MSGDENGHSIGARGAGFSQVEAEIAETRERLALSVIALEREITRAVDWREWIRRRPGPAMAMAFGLGWFLGGRR